MLGSDWIGYFILTLPGLQPEVELQLLQMRYVCPKLSLPLHDGYNREKVIGMILTHVSATAVSEDSYCRALEQGLILIGS